MKKTLRLVAGFFIVLPFMVSTKFLTLFVGRERACERIGPHVTSAAKRFLKYWVPSMSTRDFDQFSPKMKKNFWLWNPFYDIEIARDERNMFQLHITNCPFCEVLNGLGFSDLSPYVCQGDWEIARDNRDKWGFERTHQIGTGDDHCNHTYLRSEEVRK